MKILYVTTIGATMSFFRDFIKVLLKEGHSVDIATNDSVRKPPECYTDWGCRIFSLSCSRSPLDRGNWTAIGQIRRLVEREKYDIVHCHTPIAAACTRIACRKLRKTQGVRVFYTAHGFHFYKGAPLKNWLIYYPVEKICSYFTDKLITINHEDYALAKNKFHAGEVHYVPGVGIDLSRFENIQVDRAAKRREIGVPEDAFLLISVGELSARKNQSLVLKALTQMENPNIHYAIAGKGPLQQKLQDFVKEYGLTDRVHFLGYRNDIVQLYKTADICCLPSIHEGLPVALMEAMACGLAVVCSRIRGSTDLIQENGGALFDPHSADACRQAIERVMHGDRQKMGKANKELVNNFTLEKVVPQMKSIYES